MAKIDKVPNPVTAEYLQSKGASCAQVQQFKQLFPHGAKHTLRACFKAAEAELDLDWFASNCLRAQAWEAYVKATAQAWEAYEKATAPAWEAYEKATAPALEAYEKATAQAWEAYEKAKAPALYQALKMEAVL